MKVSFLTLGCKVNQYESEAIAEALVKEGFCVVPFGSPADATVINTCAVTTEGERKARQMVRRAISAAPNAIIVVTGCSSQLHPESFEKIGGVHYILGNGKKMAAVDLILSHVQSQKETTAPQTVFPSFDLSCYEEMSIEKSERTRAYIKIEDGCDSHCAYCIIRQARGKVRSRKIEDIVHEAEALLAKGYREIVLTGIEISAWGKDLGQDFITLLETLDAIDDMGRIRLGSLDPAILREDFCLRLSRLKHICHHFHLSLQSGCSKTLAAMRRKNNAEMAKDAMMRMRALMPDVTFTADIIVGFPGESEEDFAATEAFLENVSLLDCHIFAFSPRPGTEAATMPNPIAPEIKSEREKRLQGVIASTRQSVLASFLKTTAEVLFEENKNGMALGHTANYLTVGVKTDKDLHNQMLCVTFDAIENDCLIGHIVS